MRITKNLINSYNNVDDLYEIQAELEALVKYINLKIEQIEEGNK